MPKTTSAIAVYIVEVPSVSSIFRTHRRPFGNYPSASRLSPPVLAIVWRYNRPLGNYCTFKPHAPITICPVSLLNFVEMRAPFGKGVMAPALRLVPEATGPHSTAVLGVLEMGRATLG